MPDNIPPAEGDVSGAMSDSENEYDDPDGPTKDEDDKMTEHNASSEGHDTNGEPKKKYDPKDPLRPRRKKARRACYACQRAHLTCGKSVFPVPRYTLQLVPAWVATPEWVAARP